MQKSLLALLKSGKQNYREMKAFTFLYALHLMRAKRMPPPVVSTLRALQS